MPERASRPEARLTFAASIHAARVWLITGSKPFTQAARLDKTGKPRIDDARAGQSAHPGLP